MQSSLFGNPFVFLLSLALFCATNSVRAADDEQEPASASDEKPKVTKLAGVFEAINATEIILDTEHLTTLKIKRVLPHGAKVSKGQNVVWLETEEIDKQIKNAEIDLRLAKLTLDDEEFQYKQFLKTQALDKTAAELARKQAQQDFDNFAQVDRDRQLLTAEFNLKASKSSLENAMEELKQLEQMYKEDDLTEESEEIVLKRAKQAVEFAQFRLDGTAITSDRTVKQLVPRTELTQKEALERAQLTYQKAIRDLVTARQRRDLEMDRKRDKFKEEEKKMAELREERKKVVLRAEHDGILLHGKLTRGKLSDKASTLKEGSKVTAEQVIVTVVDPLKLQIRVDLEEKYLKLVSKGTKCKVIPRAFPDQKMDGNVKSVSLVPYAGSKYDCVVTFRKPKNQPTIMPTMACDLEFENGEEEEQKPEAKKKAEPKKKDEAKKKDDKK